MELAKNRKFLTRKNGVFFSIVWFIFMLLIVTPFWAIANVEEMAAFSAILGIFGSLLILLFSLFFLKSADSVPADAMAQVENPQFADHLAGQQQRNTLPSQQTAPAEQYVSPGVGSWKAPATGDLVKSGSVTEDTTRLLNKKYNKPE